jgi:hypothetical protein
LPQCNILLFVAYKFGCNGDSRLCHAHRLLYAVSKLPVPNRHIKNHWSYKGHQIVRQVRGVRSGIQTGALHIIQNLLNNNINSYTNTTIITTATTTITTATATMILLVLLLLPLVLIQFFTYLYAYPAAEKTKSQLYTRIQTNKDIHTSNKQNKATCVISTVTIQLVQSSNHDAVKIYVCIRTLTSNNITILITNN